MCVLGAWEAKEGSIRSSRPAWTTVSLKKQTKWIFAEFRVFKKDDIMCIPVVIRP